jgi:uncharacterized protein
MRTSTYYNLSFDRRNCGRRVAIARLALFLCCIAALLAGAALAQDPQQIKPKGYVNDFANVLSQPGVDQLTALCGEVQEKTQAQIAVVTIKSLGGKPIEDYSIDLATKLGVGPKASNLGVLILLAVEDHQDRIEVGYGLEPILPDGKTGSFLREAAPILRTGNYDAALLLMTRRVADVIAADHGVTLTASTSLPPRHDTTGTQDHDAHGLRTLVIFLVVMFFIFRLLGRGGPRSRWGGPGGGWIIGSILGSMMGGGFGGGGYRGGGFGGGGGGGGGGFGGFGGGSFGGGGASGSW